MLVYIISIDLNKNENEWYEVHVIYVITFAGVATYREA